MKTLNAQDIAASEDHQIERVEVPEWGGVVFVRTMPGNVRDAYECSVLAARKVNPVGGEEGAADDTEETSGDAMIGIRARLAAFTLCDEAGELLFVADGGHPDLTQIDMLGKRSAVALDRVFSVATRINHLRKEDIDELLGNSGGGRNDAPGSESPPTSE